MGNSRLVEEVRCGQTEAVVELLTAGAVPEPCALKVAIIENHEDVVRVLLNHGADIEHEDKNGCRALHHAAMHGNANIVGLLLSRGANVRAVNVDGDSALHIAACMDNADACVLLLDAGAEVNLANASRKTPLHVVSDVTPFEECMPDRVIARNFVTVCKVLLRRGADVHAMSSFGTPLMHAIRAGNHVVADVLLCHGADMRPNANGVTPLYVASTVRAVQLLLLHGADVDARTCLGCTPLWGACEYGRLDVAVALLDAGADIDVVDSRGATPLSMAVQNDHLNVAHVLLVRGAAVDSLSLQRPPVTVAAARGNVPMLRMLLERGGRDVASRPFHLVVASSCGAVETCAMLLDAGADCDAPHDGHTPLHEACIAGCIDIVRMLLRRGAKITEGALERAALAPKHAPEIVSCLLEHGARCTAATLQDILGNCITVARKSQSVDTAMDAVRLLLETGCTLDDPRVVDPACVLPGATDIVMTLVERSGVVDLVRPLYLALLYDRRDTYEALLRIIARSERPDTRIGSLVKYYLRCPRNTQMAYDIATLLRTRLPVRPVGKRRGILTYVQALIVQVAGCPPGRTRREYLHELIATTISRSLKDSSPEGFRDMLTAAVIFPTRGRRWWRRMIKVDFAAIPDGRAVVHRALALRAAWKKQRRMSWPMWQRVLATWFGVPPWWFSEAWWDA